MPKKTLKKKSSKTRLDEEYDLQCKCVTYLDHWGVLFSATVGGVYCHVNQRKRMVNSGYRKGIPDMLIYECRGKYNGLAIEFKSQYGKLSNDQRRWLDQLSERGWEVAVARSEEQFFAIVEAYNLVQDPTPSARADLVSSSSLEKDDPNVDEKSPEGPSTSHEASKDDSCQANADSSSLST